MFLSWQVPRDQTCCLKPCLPCECASRKSRPEAFFSHSPIPLNCTIYYTCCRGGGGGYGSYDSKDLGSSLRQISWSEARILGRAAWGSPTPLELETAGQGKCGEEGICGMFFSSCRCLDSDIVEPKHRTNLNKYINRCSLRPVGGLPLLRRLHALFICMSLHGKCPWLPSVFVVLCGLSAKEDRPKLFRHLFSLAAICHQASERNRIFRRSSPSSRRSRHAFGTFCQWSAQNIEPCTNRWKNFPAVGHQNYDGCVWKKLSRSSLPQDFYQVHPAVSAMPDEEADAWSNAARTDEGSVS